MTGKLVSRFPTHHQSLFRPGSGIVRMIEDQPDQQDQPVELGFPWGMRCRGVFSILTSDLYFLYFCDFSYFLCYGNIFIILIFWNFFVCLIFFVFFNAFSCFWYFIPNNNFLYQMVIFYTTSWFLEIEVSAILIILWKLCLSEHFHQKIRQYAIVIAETILHLLIYRTSS